ncbi:MAG: adenosylcobinamide-GDP ribazoletransferase [Pseudomonadota bacterium]
MQLRQFIPRGPSSPLLEEWREDIYIAFVFLTRLPLPARQNIDQASFTRALRFSPLAGAFVGAAAGSFYWLGLSFNLSSFLSALIGVAVALLLTGGLHEDGLSDTMDGFSGGWDRDHRLQIMSDSHIGAHGALALLLTLLIRAGCIAQLSSAVAVMSALIAAGALSRVMMYGAMGLLSPARQEGLGFSAGRPAPEQQWICLGLGFFIALLALPFDTALSATLAAILGGGCMGLMAKRKIGGHTGDILGAVQVIAELSALVYLASALTD